ncbi:hypothetical protein [Actinoalloteichus hymeniacidonis]|uniref:Uncharacterized protein n=1 Tax=Actinoalloteichus hymeniacidonis TaxID=340345 RepID=A0AAC9MWS3_9PSEU|nr:hypothetical protein [Actinoalloteichus hymeniacidonis]AOS61620.1 hypothetical protein TL08_03950 [Actinoalloteichus hymeniacidonis]MBB5910369.1 hypothetical protein [Actinoalloteichus hymeniacidonis]
MTEPSEFWFVRSVAIGDTHLRHPAALPAPQVAPRCEPEAVFHPLNRRPVESCFFDWQECPGCRAAAAPHSARALAVVR